MATLTTLILYVALALSAPATPTQPAKTPGTNLDHGVIR